MKTDGRTAFRLLFLIASPKLADQAAEALEEEQIPSPLQFTFRARGTASSEIMGLLGLGEIEKGILMCLLPKSSADGLLIKLQRQLYLGAPNTGVAFTLPLSGGSAHMLRLAEPLLEEEETDMAEKEGTDMTENEYSLVIAIVDQGFSEEVMDAARPMGATGGTVFNSRQLGGEEAHKALHTAWKNILVQQEREVVMILARKEEKTAIMQAISKACGPQSEAHGLILSLPVDGSAGL